MTMARAMLLIFGGLLGCTGLPTADGVQESLDIDLRANDSKLFIYRLSVPEELRQPSVRVYQSAGQAREDRQPEPPLGEGDYRRLRHRAERAVADTGYCRQGILELDYRLSREVMWFRGECREGATEDDRRRFGDRSQLSLE